MRKSFSRILPAAMVAITVSASSAFGAALTNFITAADIAPYIKEVSSHDPSTLVKCKDEFWMFHTGRGVPSWRSKDLMKWERGPSVFTNPPPWVAETVPANRVLNYWAPDIAQVNGRYLLYYSASSFGKNVSGIGLATAATLDPADPAYGWKDEGLVIASAASDDFNAIDPAIFHDKDGTLWLAFGSFWSGLRMIELDPKTGKRLAPSSPIHSLAHYDSIEAPYIYQRDGYYYLFVNWGMCCRGTNSTYRIAVGRSRKVTGPYLDMNGNDMRYGGGTGFLDTTRPYVGPGHAGIIEDHGKFWLSCHYEGIESTNAPAAGQRRNSPLAVLPMHWTTDKWPEIILKPTR